MLRRNLQLQMNDLHLQHLCKQVSHSPSTNASSSPRQHQIAYYNISSIKKDKEKSQLCKKYLQFGFCPYQKRCKFAHGCHQLKKNQQHNSKYKTKECGVYLNQGYCMYGDRCNFIHPKPILKCQSRNHDTGFQKIKAEGRLQSRLLSLLGLNQQ